MTEKAMIPVSVVDALILDFQTNGYRNNYDTKDVRDILEMIKKEAIPSPSEQDQDFDDEEDFQRWKKEYIEKPTHEQDKSVQEQGLEQKIKARIAKLGDGTIDTYIKDELRKLLK